MENLYQDLIVRKFGSFSLWETLGPTHSPTGTDKIQNSTCSANPMRGAVSFESKTEVLSHSVSHVLNLIKTLHLQYEPA